MQRRVPDLSRTRELLDWTPTRNFEAIISEVAQTLTVAREYTSPGERVYAVAM
jgi:hypothetical protein